MDNLFGFFNRSFMVTIFAVFHIYTEICALKKNIPDLKIIKNSCVVEIPSKTDSTVDRKI